MTTKTERVFVCACTPALSMDLPQLMEHLKTEHGITDGKGNRRMTMHLDGRDFYSSTYEWTFPDGVIVTETATSQREKNDPFWNMDEVE